MPLIQGVAEDSATGSSMDPRRYELVTVAAAITLRSCYCALRTGACWPKNSCLRMRSSTWSLTPTQLRSPPSIEP
jgi:hypothetical protein